PPAKGVGHRVSDSHTGNHPEDDFTPLKTIQRSYNVIREKIPFELEKEKLSRTSSRRGAGSESRPPMLNKENYVPWSSHLLRYAKSRPNEKLIHSSILNGPYVRKMIPKPGDANRDITVTEQTDDELSDKELKQIEA
nr:hypothetical protein [Tanacetum cinerariifolium]